ncbi:hypothetical protein PY650_26410 [Rhizobium calliandrae]|uniref:Uncharacterized protein n=1 Tax=Rhizobium calliandrae TaxID=1312182 RepID=A0ABT7KKH2_9HYPH|nr:hypothetical protein [Rhizobium calliandrae]MDL2409105.1 hypothetical protein [Rhizobium calliandrae]
MQRRHRRAHAAIWTGLALALPLLLAIIFASAPKLPTDAPAIRLDGKVTEGAQP